MDTTTKGSTPDLAERADARNVTPAEGRAFGTLLEEIGFAPNVMFGRDTTHLPLWFQRLIEGRVYAIVPTVSRGWQARTGVQKYTLLTVPVGTTHEGTNGTPTTARTRNKRYDRRRVWTPERKAEMSRRMKALWDGKRNGDNTR